MIVPGATRQPIPYGLFSVVTFREGGDVHWQGGVEFEALSCDPAGSVGYPCDSEGKEVTKTLERNAAGVGQAKPFTVYGHSLCSPVGSRESQQFAADHLLTREEAEVERVFWTGEEGNTPALQAKDTEVLAGGKAVKFSRALGLLEQFIADHYGSLGVIHLPRLVATELGGFGGTRTLTTDLGTPVVAGAGYPGTGPNGEEPEDGQVWVYATPALFGYRSEPFMSSNRFGDLMDKGVNDFYAIAERTYLIGFDPCGVAAVLVDTNL